MPGAKVIVWALRVVWAALALAAGPAFADALDGRSTAFVVMAAGGLWLGWAGGLVATLVPTTVSLTAIRLLAPSAVAAATWAALAGASGVRSALAVGMAVLVAALAASAEVGAAFVQGSAYGDETRFPLRPPSYVVVVLPALWATVAVGAAAGPLLLAAGLPVAGALALVVGWPAAALVARRLHRLSRRWIVIVPAGLVVHDDVALTDTLMVRRAQIRLVTLAPAGTDATDVTAGAAGLAIEVRLHTSIPVALAPPHRGGRRPGPQRAVALLVSPSRPGALLDHCALRRFPVGDR